MSKSAGNVIAPEEVISKLGADVLRLWVAAEDYRDDIKISDEILKRLADAYFRIRNTFRFLLGNIYDFQPEKDIVATPELYEIDRWALYQLHKLIDRGREAYERFEFHAVYHSVQNFCAVEMSALYFDILKDRLYTYPGASPGRRSAQTALYEILKALTALMAPILSFTAEEVWKHMPSHVRIDDGDHGLSDVGQRARLLSELEKFLAVHNPTDVLGVTSIPSAPQPAGR